MEIKHMAYPDLTHIKIHKNKSLIDDDVSTSFTNFSDNYDKDNEFIKCKSDESKKKNNP